MKIVVLGDIHGRSCWEDIIKLENDFDKVVFLGDYFTSREGISENQQIENFQKILSYKEKNPDKVVLLIGNHDTQAFGYEWAYCSPEFINTDKLIEYRSLIGNKLQWCYVYNNIVFSHAGISDVWLENNNLTIDKINSCEPSPIFGFTPKIKLSCYDRDGSSDTQPLTWIRPMSLIDSCDTSKIFIVGHTRTRTNKIHNFENVWLCDTLPYQYLVIDNGEFIIKDIK